MLSDGLKKKLPKVTNVRIGTITLGQGGYLDTYQFYPSGVSDSDVLSIELATYSGMNPLGGITVGIANISGQAGQVITDAVLRFVHY